MYADGDYLIGKATSEVTIDENTDEITALTLLEDEDENDRVVEGLEISDQRKRRYI